MLLTLSLLACIQDVSPGPNPGACAALPDGVYTWGDIGIGTCLSGPSDARFFQQDGGTFVGVTNADPYHLFRTGSLLVVDWDEVTSRIESGDGPRIPIDEVAAGALEIFDDDDGDGVGNNPYLGGFGYLPDSQSAILTSRLTEDGVGRTGRDEAFVVDLSSLELRAGMRLAGSLFLEDDPQPVLVDGATDRVYVGNLSDHSVSVLTTAVPANAELPVEKVDVATGADVSDAVLSDADGSGSFAEMTRLAVGDATNMLEESFELSFVEGTYRLWVPTPNGDNVGVVRWTSGGPDWAASAFGIEDGLGNVRDPFVETDESGLPVMWYALADGTIRRAEGYFLSPVWVTDADPIRSGGLNGAPSAAPLPDGVGLFTDRRDAPGEPASIVLVEAASTSQLLTSLSEVVLEPPQGSSYEDPFAVFDLSVHRYRMWLSVRQGDRWSVGLSESDDGRTWSEPVIVLDAPGSDVAAPAVAFVDSRYLMWTTVGDGTRWDHALSWSWDGWSWSEPVIVAPSEIPFDHLDAPRAAVQASAQASWRISGTDQGVLPALLQAGSVSVLRLFGVDMAISSGHEVDNNVVRQLRGELGLVPGHVEVIGGRTFLYATATGSGGRARVAILEQVAGEWTLAVDPEDLEAELGVAADERLSHPLLVPDAGGYTLFATLTDRDGSRLVRATTTDGLTFGRLDRSEVLADEGTEWDSAGVVAHSAQITPDGVRIWYAGDDGSRQHIGSAFAPTTSDTFVREPGRQKDWRLGTGVPGSFDDSSVADPQVVEIDGQVHLYYSGFDGSAWHLGHALVLENGAIERRIDPLTDLSVASMNGQTGTFSALGVESPTLLEVAADGGVSLLYAGTDVLARRLGLANAPALTLDALYANQRFPTAGDTLTFTTTRGGTGVEVMEMAQSTQWFVTTGFGMSALALDPDGGMLYVPSKLTDDIYVFDVRDDSTGTFRDANAMDLETMVRVESGLTSTGYRDAIVSRSRGLLYLTQRAPDGLVIIDLDRVADDDTKAPTDLAAVAVLPLPDLGEDLGARTVAPIGGAGMALTDDERFLLISHFRQNALSVVDLERGAWGEEIAWIPNVGENPHVVRVSPDQRYALIANYVGAVDPDNVTAASLAVVDLDPDSADYLSVVAWLVNQ
ncbi:MAG: hypothetical protein KC621_16390 [Myxococcales bacterium]|nr:hypothetical protein [Myxococcales bacterium]